MTQSHALFTCPVVSHYTGDRKQRDWDTATLSSLAVSVTLRPSLIAYQSLFISDPLCSSPIVSYIISVPMPFVFQSNRVLYHFCANALCVPVKSCPISFLCQCPLCSSQIVSYIISVPMPFVFQSNRVPFPFCANAGCVPVKSCTRSLRCQPHSVPVNVPIALCLV